MKEKHNTYLVASLWFAVVGSMCRRNCKCLMWSHGTCDNIWQLKRGWIELGRNGCKGCQSKTEMGENRSNEWNMNEESKLSLKGRKDVMRLSLYGGWREGEGKLLK